MNRDPAQTYPAHISHLESLWSEALARANLDAALIYAGSPHAIFQDDQDYPFKVNAWFKHWAPVTGNPHCFVFFTPGETPRMLFWQPVDFWHKPADAPEDFWVEHFDLRIIRNPEDARDELPQDLRRCAWVGEAKGRFKEWNFGAENPHDLLNYLAFHRAWKTEYELDCLRAASRLGAAAHRAAEAAFRRGASEYGIHMAYLAACEHSERELPYDNIVALNEHASVLHYQHQERAAPQRALSFLIDAGAEFHGYASDITRSYAADGGAYKELIEAMDTAQQSLCATVKPGLDYRDLQHAAHQVVGELLAQFGLVETAAEDAAASGLTRYFFPHGVGHYLGLQVHDAGGFLADESGNAIPKPEGQPTLRLTRCVEENQAFTVEPGLYFIQPLLEDLKNHELAREVNWDKVDAMRPYGGVRIEDNVIVTAGGHENMTRDAFSALAAKSL